MGQGRGHRGPKIVSKSRGRHPHVHPPPACTQAAGEAPDRARRRAGVETGRPPPRPPRGACAVWSVRSAPRRCPRGRRAKHAQPPPRRRRKRRGPLRNDPKARCPHQGGRDTDRENVAARGVRGRCRERGGRRDVAGRGLDLDARDRWAAEHRTMAGFHGATPIAHSKLLTITRDVAAEVRASSSRPPTGPAPPRRSRLCSRAGFARRSPLRRTPAAYMYGISSGRRIGVDTIGPATKSLHRSSRPWRPPLTRFGRWPPSGRSTSGATHRWGWG